MEMCPDCGEVFESINSHSTQDCFHNLQNKLTYLPPEYKHWKNSLAEYRDEWSFLSFSLRHRVAEQLMSYDYLWSLGDWLNPTLTIGKTQKILAVMAISSIYEGVLSEKVTMIVNKKKDEDPLFEHLRYRPKGSFPFWRLIEIAKVAEVIDGDWVDYLHIMREVRNWVHLSNQQRDKLTSWLNATSYSDLRNKLYEFREIARRIN